MVVSLVNPHDVLFYPQATTSMAAMTTPGCRARSGCRRRHDEDLSTKPTVQEQFLQLFNLSGAIPTPQMKRTYLNFYGNLMSPPTRIWGSCSTRSRATGCSRTRW